MMLTCSVSRAYPQVQYSLPRARDIGKQMAATALGSVMQHLSSEVVEGASSPHNTCP